MTENTAARIDLGHGKIEAHFRLIAEQLKAAGEWLDRANFNGFIRGNGWHAKGGRGRSSPNGTHKLSSGNIDHHVILFINKRSKDRPNKTVVWQNLLCMVMPATVEESINYRYSLKKCAYFDDFARIFDGTHINYKFIANIIYRYAYKDCLNHRIKQPCRFFSFQI